MISHGSLLQNSELIVIIKLMAVLAGIICEMKGYISELST